MEWQQLIGFYHVAKLGSFTAAARATFRTQSALTQQVKSLELELGSPLFERIGKRRVILTAAGEKLLGFAFTSMEGYERVVAEIRKDRGLLRGKLRIAAPFTTLYHLMPKTVGVYLRQFPAVELSLFDRSHREVIEEVKRGDADFGVVLEQAVPGALKKFRWKRVGSVLLVPEGHPLARGGKVSAEQISRYPLIVPPRDSGFSRRAGIEGLFRRYGLDYRIIMETSNVELSSLYVEMGMGISFATIAPDLPAFRGRKLEFVPLDHYFRPEYIAAVMRKDKVLAPFQKGFLDTMGVALPD